MIGMIAGFLGFEIFNSEIFFWGVKFGKYFCWWLVLSRDFFGYSEQSDDS